MKGLRRLQLGWDQARPPDAPASVVVDVTGDNSISVQILEPFEGAIGTKFKGKPQVALWLSPGSGLEWCL